MTSKRRAQASRLNGSKSRGPKTPEGKARSAQNSRRRTPTPESLAEERAKSERIETRKSFLRLLTSLQQTYLPASLLEFQLVEMMATARSRCQPCNGSPCPPCPEGGDCLFATTVQLLQKLRPANASPPPTASKHAPKVKIAKRIGTNPSRQRQ